jgi:hypothetical protein
VPRVSSFELPISASHIHLLRELPLVGCRSKTPTGHLKFDNKMKLDGNPFPRNMIGFSINMVNAVEPKDKEKVKVLTSEKAK